MYREAVKMPRVSGFKDAERRKAEGTEGYHAA